MSLEEFVARQSAWMGKLVERCRGMRMSISGPAVGKTAPWKKKRRTGGKGKADGSGAKTAGSKPRQPRRKASS
ncbi:hypothetical protein D3C76_1659920 [compost metagenome]